MFEYKAYLNSKNTFGNKYVLVLVIVVMWWFTGSKASGSTQFWPAVGIGWDIYGPWMFQFEQTFYLSKDSDSDHTKSDFTAVYKGKKDVYDIGFGFAYQNGSEDTKQERRPYVYATMRGKIFERDWSNRFMVEYRNLSDSSDYWRFRNKITLNSRFESIDTRGVVLINREKFRPYLADEVFFNSNGQGFSQNRIYLGSYVKIAENIAANVYYLFQSSENSGRSWENNNILGFELTFRL